MHRQKQALMPSHRNGVVAPTKARLRMHLAHAPNMTMHLAHRRHVVLEWFVQSLIKFLDMAKRTAITVFQGSTASLGCVLL